MRHISPPERSLPENAHPRAASVVSGLRYYSPGQGRWLSRDPVGELAFYQQTARSLGFADGSYSTFQASPRAYLFVGNSPTFSYDVLGLLDLYDIDTDPAVSTAVMRALDRRIIQACNNLSRWVTDPCLRACVQMGCDGGAVHIRASTPPGPHGVGRTIGSNPDALLSASLTRPALNIYLYPYHYVDSSGVFNPGTIDFGAVAIHEWAHGCGWQHGDSGLAGVISAGTYGGDWW